MGKKNSFSYTGWVFIDRCGKHFGTILNFLRDGSVPLPETCVEISEILAEAKYYGVSELFDACEQALQKKRNRDTNITRVTLITSQNEAQKLISVTSKVCVRFYCCNHRIPPILQPFTTLFERLICFVLAGSEVCHQSPQ